MILRSAAELESRFHELGQGDVFLGPLPAKHLRGAAAADLLERGVRCVPSVLCQLLARSKAAQAFVLKPWMAPHTRVIARRAELMDAVGYCAQHGIGAVVTKQEGMHCGHGIRRWESAEALYSAVAFTDAVYPLVLQPFRPDIADVRVIPTEVGGAFGGKNIHYVDVAAALLARKAARPVRIVQSRAEVLLASGPTSGTVMRVKVGAKRNGRITAVQAAGMHSLDKDQRLTYDLERGRNGKESACPEALLDRFYYLAETFNSSVFGLSNSWENMPV